MLRASSRSCSCLDLPDILGASVVRSTRKRSERWSERDGRRADEHDRNSRVGMWIGNEDGERIENARTTVRKWDEQRGKEMQSSAGVELLMEYVWDARNVYKLGWFRLNLMCISSIFFNFFLPFLRHLSLSFFLNKFNFFSPFPCFSMLYVSSQVSSLHSHNQYDTRVYQVQQGVTCVIDFAISRASVQALFRSCTEPYHETIIGWTPVRFTFPDKVIVGSLLC